MKAKLMMGMKAGRPSMQEIECSWIQIGSMEIREMNGCLQIRACDAQLTHTFTFCCDDAGRKGDPVANDAVAAINKYHKDCREWNAAKSQRLRETF